MATLLDQFREVFASGGQTAVAGPVPPEELARYRRRDAQARAPLEALGVDPEAKWDIPGVVNMNEALGSFAHERRHTMHLAAEIGALRSFLACPQTTRIRRWLEARADQWDECEECGDRHITEQWGRIQANPLGEARAVLGSHRFWIRFHMRKRMLPLLRRVRSLLDCQNEPLQSAWREYYWYDDGRFDRNLAAARQAFHREARDGDV